MKITVYTTSVCPYCHQLTAYLKEKGVQFEEINLSEHPEKVEELTKKTGQLGVPVTEIDEEYIIGFDIPKLKEKLGIS